MKFLLYLGRWQLSSPILWVVIYTLGSGIEATVAANFIGGCIFYWVDKWIFKPKEMSIIEEMNR